MVAVEDGRTLLESAGVQSILGTGMSDLISWVAVGVSVVSAAASWTGVIINRRSGAKDKDDKIGMVDYVRRMTEAVERYLHQPKPAQIDGAGTLNGEVVVADGENDVVDDPKVDWILANVDPIRWSLRNIGSTSAHDVEIDCSNLDVESVRVLEDSSVVTKMKALTVEIRAKWQVPLPDVLLVRSREHPEPVPVRLPKWRLR
jgi:hypothetical protein